MDIDLIHPCLKGSGDNCRGCKFDEAGLCEIMAGLIKSWNKTLSARYGKFIDIENRKTIIQQTWGALFKNVDSNYTKFQFISYANKTFQGDLNTFLRGIGWNSPPSYSVQKPPENIAELCNDASELGFGRYFSWDEDKKELNLIFFPLPKPVVNKAIEEAVFTGQEVEASKAKWLKILNRFYKNAHYYVQARAIPDDNSYLQEYNEEEIIKERKKDKAKILNPANLTFADDSSQDTETPTDKTGFTSPEISLAENTTLLLKALFNRSSKKEAKECSEIYDIDIKSGSEREKTAKKLGINLEQLKYKKKKCKEIANKIFLQILKEINDKESIFCLDLFHKLEEHKNVLNSIENLSGSKKHKMTTVIHSYEEENGYNKGEIDKIISKCRMMAIQAL